MQHIESWFMAGPRHVGNVGNVVFHKNENSAEPKRGQNKTADTFTVKTVCHRFGSDVIW